MTTRLSDHIVNLTQMCLYEILFRDPAVLYMRARDAGTLIILVVRSLRPSVLFVIKVET